MSTEKAKDSSVLKKIKELFSPEERQGITEEGLEIPADGNLKTFSAKEMQIVFQHVRVHSHVIKSLRQRSVDGRKFAAMSDGMLGALGMKNPIIVYFRDRSRKERNNFIL